MAASLRALLMTIVPIAIVATSSCANNMTHPRTEREVHEHFARIQQHEAELQQAQRRWDAHAGCAARCQASSDACAAAEALCAIARELDDPDALARCDRARHTCAQDRASTAACACDSL